MGAPWRSPEPPRVILEVPYQAGLPGAEESYLFSMNYSLPNTFMCSNFTFCNNLGRWATDRQGGGEQRGKAACRKGKRLAGKRLVCLSRDSSGFRVYQHGFESWQGVDFIPVGILNSHLI